MADAELEQQFHEAMLEIYRRAKVEAGYNASRFLQLVEAVGGVAAARQLVTGPPSDGFTKLWEKGRLDLSVEAHVLRPEFASLFTDDVRRTAYERLRQFDP